MHLICIQLNRVLSVTADDPKISPAEIAEFRVKSKPWAQPCKGPRPSSQKNKDLKTWVVAKGLEFIDVLVLIYFAFILNSKTWEVFVNVFVKIII